MLTAGSEPYGAEVRHNSARRETGGMRMGEMRVTVSHLSRVWLEPSANAERSLSSASDASG